MQSTGEMMTLLQQDFAESTTVYYLINGMPFSGTGFGFNSRRPAAVLSRAECRVPQQQRLERKSVRPAAQPGLFSPERPRDD